MTKTTLPASGRRSWLSRWFAGGNHHTGELANHVIDRIAEENARAFARRAEAEAARRAEDTDVLPRVDQHRDSQGEVWSRTPNGRYTCESATPGYLEDWPLADVKRVFGPLTAVSN